MLPDELNAQCRVSPNIIYETSFSTRIDVSLPFIYPSPAENRENLNFYWLFRAISFLYNTCGIMETPTFHKMSHAVAQGRTLTHRHTTGHWDSLVIYEGIFIDGLYDQLEWYL